MKLTAEALRQVLDYQESTGTFKWKVGRGRARSGDVAGCLVVHPKTSYRWIQIRLYGVLYPSHRLAWLHHFGFWPDGEIDHINQDSTDNAISNLRDTVRSVNSKNQHMKSSNTSGFTGVYWEERTKKLCAEVKVNGVKNRLGRFADIKDAAEAVHAFRKCTGFTELHGVAKRLQEA